MYTLTQSSWADNKFSHSKAKAKFEILFCPSITNQQLGKVMEELRWCELWPFHSYRFWGFLGLFPPLLLPLK